MSGLAGFSGAAAHSATSKGAKYFLLPSRGWGWGGRVGFLVWNRFPLNMTEGGGTVTVQCMEEGINLGLSLPRLGNGLLGDQ